jgi:phosphoribosylanthranilate isomerase
MKLKVCGLKHPNNINAIQNLKVDFTGFIFYDKSSRNIELTEDVIQTLNRVTIQKVGVFVNEELNEIKRLKKILGLDYIQLHGNESVEFCRELQVHSKIIKVFKVDDDFDFSECEPFRFADYFLFETKGKLAGGNGVRFNWQILNRYEMNIPFFLSGGIGLTELEDLKKIKHPQLAVVDVNSVFENEPGVKNVELIKYFKNELPSR